MREPEPVGSQKRRARRNRKSRCRQIAAPISRGGAGDRKGPPPRRAALFVGLNQFYGGGVDAVALAGGTRPVRKDVPEMRVAAAANDFLARHAVAHVALDLH